MRDDSEELDPATARARLDRSNANLATIREQFDAVIAAPTREGMELRLRRSMLRREHLQLLIAGVENADPRVVALAEEIASLDRVIATREQVVDLLRVRFELADENIGHVARSEAIQRLMALMSDVKAALAAGVDLGDLGALPGLRSGEA